MKCKYVKLAQYQYKFVCESESEKAIGLAELHDELARVHRGMRREGLEAGRVGFPMLGGERSIRQPFWNPKSFRSLASSNEAQPIEGQKKQRSAFPARAKTLVVHGLPC